MNWVSFWVAYWISRNPIVWKRYHYILMLTCNVNKEKEKKSVNVWVDKNGKKRLFFFSMSFFYGNQKPHHFDFQLTKNGKIFIWIINRKALAKRWQCLPMGYSESNKRCVEKVTPSQPYEQCTMRVCEENWRKEWTRQQQKKNCSATLCTTPLQWMNCFVASFLYIFLPLYVFSNLIGDLVLSFWHNFPGSSFSLVSVKRGSLENNHKWNISSENWMKYHKLLSVLRCEEQEQE